MIEAPQIWATQQHETPASPSSYPGRDILALRWLLLTLVLVSTATAAIRLWLVLRIDGFDTPKLLFLSLFIVLFGWISTSFWIACVGAWAKWLGIEGTSLIRRNSIEAQAAQQSPTRTAIVMPIFNEDVGRVFANIRSMIGSLINTGAIARFDFYILSDTRDPTCRAAEEFFWASLQCDARTLDARVYYRHRQRNVRRKSGNIADFCRNWGSLYDYMIVLDADSLMSGATIVALAGLMDSNSRAALIQVPPRLIGRESLFARLQQFASSVYGPLYAAGLACLQGADGNYWGHNAIIRVAPFMRHCGLPALPGAPPLGGELLSHDFVEAALLRSAGWELYLAPELGGSYEEPPPTIIDHLKRDRRWCQGNLQHLRLVFARGFRLPSRLHLLFGVMSYLAAPLWALMLASSASVAYESKVFLSFTYVGRYPVLRWPDSHVFELAMLVLATSTLLFGPKLIALLVLFRDRDMRRAHGGALLATLGVVVECMVSVLIAPIAMLSHCGFVASILLGKTTHWASQCRREYRPELSAVVNLFAPHTLIAICAALAVHSYLPDSFGWFVPLLLGAALSIPIAVASSSVRLGRLSRRMGLFLIPSESSGPPL